MKRKLTMSVSRDVLESVVASQICFCNVDEDTILDGLRRQHSPGICFGLLANCWWTRLHGIFWQLAIPSMRAPVLFKNPKCKLRKHKNILRKLI